MALSATRAGAALVLEILRIFFYQALDSLGANHYDKTKSKKPNITEWAAIR
jgi:hypothetical protein